jgi:hypothetical protein
MKSTSYSFWGEATEPLFTFEIAELLNGGLKTGPAYTTREVVRLLQGLHE